MYESMQNTAQCRSVSIDQATRIKSMQAPQRGSPGSIMGEKYALAEAPKHESAKASDVRTVPVDAAGSGQVGCDDEANRDIVEANIDQYGGKRARFPCHNATDDPKQPRAA